MRKHYWAIFALILFAFATYKVVARVTADGSLKGLSRLEAYSFDEACAMEKAERPELGGQPQGETDQTMTLLDRAAAIGRTAARFDGTLNGVRIWFDACALYGLALQSAPSDAARVARDGARTSGIAACERIIRDYPDAKFIPGVYAEAARIYGCGGKLSKTDVQKALLYAEKAITFDPQGTNSSDYCALMLLKAGWLAQLGSEAEAISVCMALEKSDNASTSIKAKLFRAEIYVAVKKQSDAQDYLEKLVQESPKDSEIANRASKRLEEIKAYRVQD